MLVIPAVDQIVLVGFTNRLGKSLVCMQRCLTTRSLTLALPASSMTRLGTVLSSVCQISRGMSLRGCAMSEHGRRNRLR